LGVDRFDNIHYPEKKCTKDKDHCITYGGSSTNYPVQFLLNDYDTAVIFMGGVQSGEDHDRPMLGFSDKTNSMI